MIKASDFLAARDEANRPASPLLQSLLGMSDRQLDELFSESSATKMENAIPSEASMITLEDLARHFGMPADQLRQRMIDMQIKPIGYFHQGLQVTPVFRRSDCGYFKALLVVLPAKLAR